MLRQEINALAAKSMISVFCAINNKYTQVDAPPNADCNSKCHKPGHKVFLLSIDLKTRMTPARDCVDWENLRGFIIGMTLALFQIGFTGVSTRLVLASGSVLTVAVYLYVAQHLRLC